MMHAFFVKDWRQPLGLLEQEIHHLTNVLRLKNGENILLLDGKGGQARAKIVRNSKKSVGLELEGEVIYSVKPEPALTMALGWGKAIRRSFLLEKSVEFEADGIWFWQADHSQFQLPDTSKENWQSQLMAGAKQSHNPWLPQLRTLPSGLKQLIEQAQGFANKFVLLGRNEAKMIKILDETTLKLSGDRIFALGPEGGLSQKEIEAILANGFIPVSLGDRILRWESAALLCLGLHWWHRQISTD